MTPFINVALLTSLLALLMVSLPPFTVILAVFWGASLVIGAYYLSRNSLITVIIINVIIIFSMTGLETTFTYLAFFGFPVIVMSLMAHYGRGYQQLQSQGIIAAVLGVSLLLGWMFYSTGELGIKNLEQELTIRAHETLEIYEENGILDFYQDRGISKTELEDEMVALMGSLARHLPAFYYLQAILAVFFMLILAAFLSRKRNLDRLIRRPFDQEIMPWQMVWVFITGLAMWLWGRDQLSTIYYVGSNILLITVPIALYYGLAAVIFKVKHYQKSTRRIMVIVLITLTLLFPVSAAIFLTVIGLFDSLLDYRRLRTKEEEI